MFMEDSMPSPTPELRDTMVRAGAGAGKTTGLVNKVIDVYRSWPRLEGTRGPRIVLTTFTRKATQELKERLITRAVNEKDAALLQFVSDPSRLQISTIHGLLNVFLKQVGHLAGLDSGFQIVDGAQAQHMARLALREVLLADPDGMSWLEVYGFGRLLEMCRKYEKFQLQQGTLQPAAMADIDAAVKRRVDYWRRAFREVIADLQGLSEEPWRKYAAELSATVAGWGVPDGTLPKKPNRSKKDNDLEAYHEVIDKLQKKFKDEFGRPTWKADLWPHMAASWAKFSRLANGFTERLQAVKNEQARFEMDDLELKTAEILRAQPFLAEVFGEAWDFWMVDEYQDTSPLQAEVLSRLIGTHPKYLVGDPQQSIYLFRGADVEVFRQAEVKISSEGGDTVELKRNYRSDPALLLFINDFVAALDGEFMRMQTKDVDSDGPAPPPPIATFFRAADPASEAQGIVARVHQLLNAGARLEEICVISRTHKTLMEISRALKEYGYPTHVHASRGFNTRREVLDAQALYKFLINPHDNMNLMILLRSPWFFTEDQQLADWMEARPHSLWRKLSALEQKPEAVERLNKGLAQIQREGLVRSFESLLRDNALIDLSLYNDPAGRKESNLWKLIHKAQTLEKQGGQSLLDLLVADAENPLDVTEGDAASAQEPNCINLMTIHGSKGLEFDHVLIPRMHEPPNQSITPSLHADGGQFYFPVWNDDEVKFVPSPLDFLANRQRRDREQQEYGRWLYVALTRAKKSLTLSWSGTGLNSWVDGNGWFLHPKGLVTKEDYAFEVVEEMPPAQRYQGESAAAVKVRIPFQPPQTKESEHFSVSELVEAGKPPSTADLLKRWQAQAAGTRIHRALEALKYGGGENAESDPAVRFVMGLEDPPVREWIETGHVEWGFQVRTQSRVIEGQIDLWAEHDGKIYVVDYKSGSPQQKETAFRQLSLYAWALRKFGHDVPMQLVVIYPLAKKVEQREFTEDLFLAWENELSGT